MRLPRPYIPLRVRVQVAERQCREKHGYAPPTYGSVKFRLGALLHCIFGDQKVELHHRPALLNREKVYRYDHSKPGLGKVFFGYKPAANDHEFLVYVTKEEHGIETRVRGQGAQLSDLAIARKRKRKERKAKAPKRKWPKRKFPERRT